MMFCPAAEHSSVTAKQVELYAIEPRSALLSCDKLEHGVIGGIAASLRQVGSQTVDVEFSFAPTPESTTNSADDVEDLKEEAALAPEPDEDSPADTTDTADTEKKATKKGWVQEGTNKKKKLLRGRSQTMEIIHRCRTGTTKKAVRPAQLALGTPRSLSWRPCMATGGGVCSAGTDGWLRR
jgi:hypothetical protein